MELTTGERLMKFETKLDAHIEQDTKDQKTNEDNHKEIMKEFIKIHETFTQKLDKKVYEEDKKEMRSNTRSWVQWIPVGITLVLALVSVVS